MKQLSMIGIEPGSEARLPQKIFCTWGEDGPRAAAAVVAGEAPRLVLAHRGSHELRGRLCGDAVGGAGNEESGAGERVGARRAGEVERVGGVARGGMRIGALLTRGGVRRDAMRRRARGRHTTAAARMMMAAVSAPP
jgi:hypothetical protein